ncbi:MAG: hypothetical protein ACLR99_06220 [Acutalibacteraceae bacterium]
MLCKLAAGCITNGLAVDVRAIVVFIDSAACGQTSFACLHKQREALLPCIHGGFCATTYLFHHRKNRPCDMI